MPAWPPYPTLYEINTWVWLAELSSNTGSSIDLGSVPPAEWDAIAALGFDAVWLMGVWERSPAGITIANLNRNLQADFRRALPDFCSEDNVGSPYCVRRYVVDRHLGGQVGLQIARDELAERGLRLVLDFVPNHVAPDHPWVKQHPEYFIQGSSDDLRNDPAFFVEIEGKVFACGKDPYFPAWPDVLQLNAFQLGLREAVVDTLADIADQCDGVRCDMAMLSLDSVFERTWGSRAGKKPAVEYWDDVISALTKISPNFLFIAEAYWDMEWQLQQNGFDFCYDKRLYDRLEHDDAESVRLHLCADLAYQQKLLRFLENHDEPRAAASFGPEKERAAAIVTSTLPGARMFHEGQLNGRKVRLPVFLGRRPEESVDTELNEFYRKLLMAINSPVFHEGHWSLCECSGWPDNPSYRNVVAWTWEHNEDRCVIVVNLSDSRAQAMIHPGWNDLNGRNLILKDNITNVSYERSGSDIQSRGLYVDLAPWGSHFLQSLLSTAVGR